MNQQLPVALSRRRFLTGVCASSALSALMRAPLFAKDQGIVPTMIDAAASAVISVKLVRRNIKVLEGSGGNIAVLTGQDGKLLVDSGFAVSRPAISNALASIDSAPVKHLINTHWHTDHTDGNAWLHAQGAVITAHENTRKHLSVDTRVDGWNWTFPAAPSGALPVRIFSAKREMHRNDTRIVLTHYSPAHTDSDISVHFTDADVVHLGDTWWNGVYPFIDYSTGGSIDGSIRAAETNLTAFSAGTIVIPGHGPIGGRTELTGFRDMLVTIRDNVAALKKQGRSLEDTIVAQPTAAFDAKWGGFLITPAAFTALVYMGV